MVTVHTVFGAALALTDQAAATQASSAAPARNRGLARAVRCCMRSVFHSARRRRKGM
jgi:hypothetical protein